MIHLRWVIKRLVGTMEYWNTDSKLGPHLSKDNAEVYLYTFHGFKGRAVVSVWQWSKAPKESIVYWYIFLDIQGSILKYQPIIQHHCGVIYSAKSETVLINPSWNHSTRLPLIVDSNEYPQDVYLSIWKGWQHTNFSNNDAPFFNVCSEMLSHVEHLNVVIS